MTSTALTVHQQIARARWALMFGNFAIGCGVMVVAGSLNDLISSLNVSVAAGGQLIAISGVIVCFGAPALAVAFGGWDRRRLLAASLAWYAVWHGLCALSPDYQALLPLRALSIIPAAVYTPQAAAAIGYVAPPEERGRSIIFIFLGWSVASVIGMPVHSFIGEAFGWRWAFALVTALSAGGAWWVWRVMPDGIRPPPMPLTAWREVFTHPVLMAIIVVTALSGAAQSTLYAYMAPYYRQVIGANAAETGFLFFWTGALGLLGNVLLSRYLDRIGAAKVVALSLSGMALSMLIWPLAVGVASMTLVILPWALTSFASNSAQQARLGSAAPHLATALMALNSSAIYLGQAVGAAGGGAVVVAHEQLGESGHDLYRSLHWIALAWMVCAIVLSVWAQRQTMRLRGQV